MLSLCAACDSGGSDDSSSDSGSLKLSIDPGTISPGTLAFLEVTIRESDFDDLDSHGLTVKLLVPNDFAFLSGSASFTRDSGAIAIAPIFYGAAPEELVRGLLEEDGVETPTALAASDEFSFLVFSLPPSMLAGEDNGELRMSLNIVGVPKVSAVYADLDRDASSSFSPEASDFDLENSMDVDIALPSVESEDD